MLLSLLLLLGHLTITAWTQNSSVIYTALLKQAPMINGHAIALPSGAFLFLISNNNLTPASPQPDELFPHRIVGGHKISIREAPHQVAVLGLDGSLCGGSILNRYWVLTAAHCYTSTTEFYIRAGSRFYRRGGTTKLIKKFIVHPNFSLKTINNDVALIKVRRPFKYSRYVRPIKLVSSNSKSPKAYFVTGWGLTSENSNIPSPALRSVKVKSIPRRTCARYYAGRVRITKKMICAAAPQKDSCSGDSGGPLVRHGRQYGIVSFGIGCARKRSPGVYTDIRKFRKYIDNVMKNH